METKSNLNSVFFSFSKDTATALSSDNISKPMANIENGNTKFSNSSSSIINLLNEYFEDKDQNSTSLANFINKKDKEEMDKNKDYFIKLLKSTTFEDGIDNEATDYFSELINKNRAIALQLINTIYNDSVANNDNETTIKILDLLSDYPLKKLDPNAQLMVVVSMANKNRFIQARALKVLEHWMDYNTLKMAGEIEITSPWVNMMFNKIKEKIEKKHVSKSL